VKISIINRQSCRTVQEAALAELQKVADKYGLVVQSGGGTFTSTSFRFKVEFAVVDDSGVAQSRDATHFERYCTLYGLKPEDLGREFVYRGSKYTIVGLSSRSRKFPILTTQEGRGAGQVKFTKQLVLDCLKSTPKAKPGTSKAAAENTGEFKKGDTVMAAYEGDMYEARVLAYLGSGTYKVRFVEDGVIATTNNVHPASSDDEVNF